MNIIERITQELSTLGEQGIELLQEGQKEPVVHASLGPKYEIWYTKSLAAVSQIIPERLQNSKKRIAVKGGRTSMQQLIALAIFFQEFQLAEAMPRYLV